MKSNGTQATPTLQQLQVCRDVLQRLSFAPEACLPSDSTEAEILRQAATLMRRVRSLNRRETKERDRELRQAAPIRRQRRDPDKRDDPFSQHLPSTYSKARCCYVCRRPYAGRHEFYDSLCQECGEFNFAKRTATADLRDHRAVVTGGRVKIGFQIALKLLRSGAETIVTTRFPVDADQRFRQQPDFDDWSQRLQIYGLDFRWLPAVEELADRIGQRWDSMQILINNAAQTIRRPPAFYQHLIDRERAALGASEAAQRIAGVIAPQIASHGVDGAGTLLSPQPISAAMSQLKSQIDPQDTNDFPLGQLDEHGQQVDLRDENSWVKPLSDVSTVELLEVQAVNCLAPFLLIRRLEPLLAASSWPQNFIVNVSAMEGRFSGAAKTGMHPHTNIAKAGLNMITRTCADQFALRGIYMNSVDTGWVTNEYPFERTERMKQGGFEPPLDEIDGAARVCDPIFSAIASGAPVCGKFLKDYQEISW